MICENENLLFGLYDDSQNFKLNIPPRPFGGG